MKIFMTGSSGFIGSHMKAYFNNHEIMEFDNKTNLFNDITIQDAVTTAIVDFQPDVIIHLAANANPGLSTKFPREDLMFNTLGTINLLEACRKVPGLKAFLFSSAAQAYGEPHTIQ